MRISVEGAEPQTARVVVILLHGGGASALDFLGLSQEFPPGDDVCWLAPQALNQHWHPLPANAPRAKQEPHFTVSVKSILGLLEKHSSQRLVLVGFADGASVVAELLTDPDLPRSVVGAWLASGGMLGEEENWPERPKLASLPVLVSGGRDIPEDTSKPGSAARPGDNLLAGEQSSPGYAARPGDNLLAGEQSSPGLSGDRMAATARFFEAAGAKVTRYLYDGVSALINAEELKLAQGLLRETRK